VRKYDVIYSAAFLAIAALAFFLFYRDMNATLTKGNEAPIATVTEKINDVERHFAARLMWDKLQYKTPIYNRDIIRTTNDASVDIVFTGDDELEVGPASLIQVRWTPAGNEQYAQRKRIEWAAVYTAVEYSLEIEFLGPDGKYHPYLKIKMSGLSWTGRFSADSYRSRVTAVWGLREGLRPGKILP
jgi:hypothetical protein